MTYTKGKNAHCGFKSWILILIVCCTTTMLKSVLQLMAILDYTRAYSDLVSKTKYLSDIIKIILLVSKDPGFKHHWDNFVAGINAYEQADFQLCYTHTHTCTHACTHARTHTHTHTYTNAYTILDKWLSIMGWTQRW